MISTKLRLGGVIVFLLFSLLSPGALPGASPGPDDERERLATGAELFTREWLPGDKRSFAGDGLGPVHNARSCAACHHQGGIGGAGPRGSNARLVSAFVDSSSPDDLRVIIISGVSVQQEATPQTTHKQLDRNKLAEIHPALRNEGSFSLHRFSTDSAFQKWQSQKLSANSPEMSFGAEKIVGFGFAGGPGGLGGRSGSGARRASVGNEKGDAKKDEDVRIVLIQSERNTPALFGAGLIDTIPDRVLLEVAAEQTKLARSTAQSPQSANPETSRRGQDFGWRSSDESLPISGRVATLKDGKIGRFGWKASVSTLREFTLQACSNELGLEVPGFPRAAPPWIKDYKAPGLDLTADQCDCLVRFVASLPRPVVRKPETDQHAEEISAGRTLFAQIGCAACHRPKLGDVEGIYSDLLLHDMGQLLSGTGFYATNLELVKAPEPVEPLPASRASSEGSPKEKPPQFGAGAREWRTPPLWGLRDSGPYLHHGLAETITAAIRVHGGEGLAAAQSFNKLSPQEQMEIELFLQSLAAPPNLP